MGDEELVALAEAARQIDRSREWLRLRVASGEVRHRKIGRVIGIPDSEIKRLKIELSGKPKPRGHWPKGKARKPAPFTYPTPGDHATGRLMRAAETDSDYRPPAP